MSCRGFVWRRCWRQSTRMEDSVRRATFEAMTDEDRGSRGVSIAVADCCRHDLWMDEHSRERLLDVFGCVTIADLLDGYAGGGLGKQEFASAARWFEQAAARGMTDSQFNLGMLYARGLGVPQDFEATRYHSLAIKRETLPDCLEITAWTDDGEIMGVRHKTLAVEGVQFHPESILTERGHDLLKNFLVESRRGASK